LISAVKSSIAAYEAAHPTTIPVSATNAFAMEQQMDAMAMMVERKFGKSAKQDDKSYGKSYNNYGSGSNNKDYKNQRAPFKRDMTKPCWACDVPGHRMRDHLKHEQEAAKKRYKDEKASKIKTSGPAFKKSLQTYIAMYEGEDNEDLEAIETQETLQAMLQDGCYMIESESQSFMTTISELSPSDAFELVCMLNNQAFTHVVAPDKAIS
jgi:hypothetical protein